MISNTLNKIHKQHTQFLLAGHFPEHFNNLLACRKNAQHFQEEQRKGIDWDWPFKDL